MILIVGLANANSCTTMTSQCSSNMPDSTLGFGAAEICGECYLCGVADGVCPEDFYDSSEQLQGSCALCPDPDCSSTLEITIINEGGLPNSGDANIDITYIETTVPSITNRHTDASGTATINAYSGNVNVRIQEEGYATQSQDITLIRGETYHLTFTNFSEAPCQEDNTRGDGVCHEECYIEYSFPVNELGNYTANDVITACNQKNTNTTAMLGSSENHYFSTGCCVGDITETIRPIININDFQEEKEITELVTHVQGIFYNGEKIFMVSTISKEEEN